MAGPVQVAAIDTSDNTAEAKIDVNKIKMVVEKNKIEDIPVVIIALAGIARKGKSFLLSLMIAYLKHMSLSTGNEFKNSSSVISGMNWAGGRKAVTKGIWLWEEAFKIRRWDNSEIAVLLLDTQGICDGVSSANKNVDSQIIYMTLSMATIYIHNVDKEWKLDERKVYQICKNYGEIHGGVNQLFNSFTLLYRNWCEDNEFGIRTDVFKEEIEDSKEDNEAYRIVNGINELFLHKTAWVLSEPSDAVRKQQVDGNISLAGIGEDFLENFVAFAKALFDPDGHYSKQMDCAVTGRIFIERMEDLSERLKDWPDLVSDADQLKDIYLRKIYNSAKERFDDEYKSMECKDSDQVRIELVVAEKMTIEHFREKANNVSAHDKSYNYYLTKLKSAIEKKKLLCTQEAEKRDKENQLKKLISDMEGLSIMILSRSKEMDDQQMRFQEELKKMAEEKERLTKEIKSRGTVIDYLKGAAAAASAAAVGLTPFHAPTATVLGIVGSAATAFLNQVDQRN